MSDFFFKLPLVTDLTEDQQMALDETKPIALSGGAGTGKTVVSLWRHLQNIEDLNKNSVLITFTKTLTMYLQSCLNSVENKNSSQSNPSQRVYNYHYLFESRNANINWISDETIIDEAQDLTLEQINKAKRQTNCISYGADFNQQLYTGKISETDIKSLCIENIEYVLQQNFRNSFYMLQFVKAALPSLYISQESLNELRDSNLGLKPIMYLCNTDESELNRIIESINEFHSSSHNIGILLTTAEEVTKYFDLMNKHFPTCTHYHSRLNSASHILTISDIHITTIKSSKGLEFDTVIIPRFDQWGELRKTKYFTDKDCYVSLTRAKRNLFLFTKHEINSIENSTFEFVK